MTERNGTADFIGDSGEVRRVRLADLLVDDAYQRPLKAHSKRIFKRFNPAACAPLLVGERPDGSLQVIDGQQRLRAIMAFLKGECGAQVFHDGKAHTYQYAEMNELERGAINGLGGMRVVFVDISREDRLCFYLRLNGGVAHTEQELDKVRKMLVTEFPTPEGE